MIAFCVAQLRTVARFSKKGTSIERSRDQFRGQIREPLAHVADVCALIAVNRAMCMITTNVEPEKHFGLAVVTDLKFSLELGLKISYSSSITSRQNIIYPNARVHTAESRLALVQCWVRRACLEANFVGDEEVVEVPVEIFR